MDYNKRMNDLLGQDMIVYYDSGGLNKFMNLFTTIAEDRTSYPYREKMDLNHGGTPESMQCYKKALFNLVIAHKPKTIVELGVREGNSSDAFIRALKYYDEENLDEPGRLTSFDPGSNGYDILAQGMFLPESSKYWDFYTMTGEAGYEKFGDKIIDIDLLYIDTDPHSFKQMTMWLNDYWIQNVRAGGLVVFDDCAPQHQEGVNFTPAEVWNVGAQFGVLRAVLEFVDNNQDRVDFAMSVCNVRSNGVGVIKLK